MAAQPPFEFIFDFLPESGVEVKPMFGCFGVFYGGRIVLFLRERENSTDENGIWIATHSGGAESLAEELSLNPPQPDEKKKWILIPLTDPLFESKARRTCEMIYTGDGRIGR